MISQIIMRQYCHIMGGSMHCQGNRTVETSGQYIVTISPHYGRLHALPGKQDSGNQWIIYCYSISTLWQAPLPEKQDSECNDLRSPIRVLINYEDNESTSFVNFQIYLIKPYSITNPIANNQYV